MILVDTNVLLRIAQPRDPMSGLAISAINALRTRGEELCVVPQVLYEFWVVATRPKERNGLGMTAIQADADLAKMRDRFRLINDDRGIFRPWRELVTRFGVLGKNAHDARLVAAIQRHGIAGIVSFNASHFKRYPGINVIDPTTSATS
jgi:predicted nucleic acid-binding protein